MKPKRTTSAPRSSAPIDAIVADQGAGAGPGSAESRGRRKAKPAQDLLQDLRGASPLALHPSSQSQPVEKRQGAKRPPRTGRAASAELEIPQVEASMPKPTPEHSTGVTRPKRGRTPVRAAVMEVRGTGEDRAPRARAKLSATEPKGGAASFASNPAAAALPGGADPRPPAPKAAQPVPPLAGARRPEAGAASAQPSRPAGSPASSEQAAAQPGEPDGSSLPAPDWDRLARNMGLALAEAGKAASAFLKPHEARKAQPSLASDVSDLFKTFGQVAGDWMSDPGRLVQAQTAYASQFIDLWSRSLQRFSGATTPSQPEPAKAMDRRFAAPEWRQNPVFDFLRQSYLMTTDWASSMVDEAEGLDPETREKARFYLRQVSSALSPSNFLLTNPELLKETFDQSGENLVRGMRMLAEDIEAGKGELKIRQSDRTPFELGVNMAVTPGKVVLRNDLMELIQYAPSTAEVFRRPLLIVPPWINKFYVLDLNPEKSFVRWAVEQGLTVFVISWVNPDERHADKDFEAYMREGIFGALDAIEQATGEREVATIGYCVGGTLLAITLAYMAARGDDRISSATFFTAQVDFRDAGDLKVFAGEEQIQALEAEMAEKGYLNGTKMANAFNMLRPNELIWSFVVNNYIKGKAPSAFDLLTWNSDSTRMPRANHAFYLRNCYLENRLTKREMTIGGETLDLGKVTIPVYNLATREDHIAPARSVFTGAKFFGGPMRYVLAGSGHIAGVVNPPAKAKYQYWEGPSVEGNFEDWLAHATEHRGTWWPDWLAWLTAQAPQKVAARVPGEGKLPALCDAPGEYVRVQA